MGHVEASLRSFDRSMAEEMNRVLTDSISDLLFITERSAEKNLRSEGISVEKIYFVGNTMIDTLLEHKKKAEASSILERLGCKQRKYAVSTLHRPSNVDDPVLLREIFDGLNEISKRIKIVFPVHPRTGAGMGREQSSLNERIILCEPLGYLNFLKLIAGSRFVLTDSGGIQEETTVLGAPYLTIREKTERPVTLTEGTNRRVGMDRRKTIQENFKILNGAVIEHRVPELWDGKAAERTIEIIVRHFKGKG